MATDETTAEDRMLEQIEAMESELSSAVSQRDLTIRDLRAQLAAAQEAAKEARGKALSDARGVLMAEWRKHPGTQYGDDLWALMGMIRNLGAK